MHRTSSFTQDHIDKDFLSHPLAASDLINAVRPGAAAALGLEGPFHPEHVQPAVGLELQRYGTTDSRRPDLVFWIRDRHRGQTLGVVHVEVQDRIQPTMPARCLDYAARLKEYLLKAGIRGANGRRVPLLQLLVHTGRGPWTRYRPEVPHTGTGDLWDTGQDMPMLDIGQHQNAAWATRPLTTETEAFIALTLLHRDASRLFQGDKAQKDADEGRIVRFSQQLYNLSVRRAWAAHGLDRTVVRWIVDGIVRPAADTLHFTPRLLVACTLKEIVMNTQTLRTEFEEVREWIKQEGHAEGHAEGHVEGLAEGHVEGLAEAADRKRDELLEVAAPYLSPAAWQRCAAGLAQQDWADLPRLADVVVATARENAPQALERLLTGREAEPDERATGRF